jgi:PAS domain S-box-containing protein
MPDGPPLHNVLLAQHTLPVAEIRVGTAAVLRANHALGALVGYAPAELAGRSLFDLLPEEESEACRAFLLGQPGDGGSHTYHLLVRDAPPRAVVLTVIAAGSPPGNVASPPALLLAEPLPTTETASLPPPAQEQSDIFRHIVLCANDGIWTVDAEQRIAFVNQRMADMLGYTPAELTGRLITDFIHPEELADHANQIVRRRSGEAGRYERRFLRKDGSVLWTLVAGAPLRSPDGVYHGAFGLFSDITARKQADHALQISEERYRSLLAAATDYVFTVPYAHGRPGTTVHGPGCVKVTGYEPGDYAADPFLWYRMIAADDRIEVERHIRQATEGERAATLEHRIIHRDGSIRWVRNTLVPRRDANSTLVAVDGLITDITERHLAEESLRLSEHQLRLIIDTVPALIAYIGTDGRYRLLNETFHLWFGDPIAAILLCPLSEHFGPEAWTELSPLFDRALAGETAVFEKELPLRAAGRRWIHGFFTPDHGPEGAVRGIVLLANDITARKQLEAQLLHSQRLEAVGRLSSGIAHDLNNILQPVLVAPRLLRPALTDPAAIALVDTIEGSVRRGAEIIKQLLDFGRGSAARRVPLRLDTLVVDLARILSETLPKDIVLHCELPAHVQSVMADDTQLRQVLMNLCINARDAMPTGGALTIRLSVAELARPLADAIPGGITGRFQVLTVSDTGTGIAPENFPKLFDPFFTTKDVGEGTGLGLSTVLAIVRSHDGFVHVSSTVGVGSVFRVFLPETAAATAAETPPPALRPAPAPVTGTEGRQRHILVVDDENAVRDLIRQTLLRHDYRISEAANGAEALVLLAQRESNVDLVIADLLMPVLDGASLIRELHRRRPHLPIVAMSGNIAGDQIAPETKAAIQALLPKPFDAAQLLASIEASVG